MAYFWELSQFDTDIFGYKVAKITGIDALSSEWGKNVSHLIKELEMHEIRYATFRVHANNFPLIQALEDNGFNLVDGLITLEAKLTSFETERFTGISFAVLKDLKQIEDIGGSVFNVSRYYHDPVIPKSKADLIYKRWVANSLNGTIADTVLIYKEKKQILGLVTLTKTGYIPLVGVSQNARGKGIGKKLVISALHLFKDWGITKAIIETQITNIPALRVYQACGFKVVDSHLTFRWYNPYD